MLVRASSGSGGGGGTPPTIISTTSKATSNVSGEIIFADNIKGTITITQSIAVGETLFTVSPAPSQERTDASALALVLSGTTYYCSVKIDTSGNVINTGQPLAVGYTWDVDIKYMP